MLSVKVQVNMWKILVLLEIINYQVVTVFSNDFVAFKFLRDILLILIVVLTFSKNKIKINRLFISILIFIIAVLLNVIRTTEIGVALTFVRKYLSPLLLFIALLNTDFIDERIFNDFTIYLLNVFSIVAVWGIFQAYILGPEFLISMGYPTKFSYAYNDITLKDSFYFGNLGIQRVVSTISNSNVCALILGSFLIFISMNFNKVIKTKFDVAKLLVVFIAYVLTFSRANILALIIVGLFFLWKYLPKKHIIFMIILGFFIVFTGVYFIQDNNGITHKLVKWVINSLLFKESSSAGRVGIWKDAFNAIVNKPMGYGYGYVGAYAQMNKVESFYHCENSYLAIAIDMGIIALLLFINIFVSLFLILRKYRKYDSLKVKMIKAIILYISITFMFSNHIYDREAMMVVFILLGLTLSAVGKEKKDEIFSDSVHI